MNLEPLKEGFRSGLESVLFILGVMPGAILTGVLFIVGIFLIFFAVAAIARALDS